MRYAPAATTKEHCTRSAYCINGIWPCVGRMEKMSWCEEHFKSFHVFSVLFLSDHFTIDT
uniref:Uncharacterized protein n=1 Tax=Anguilla anguilla TaxID=7936 RepID=A0A0E9URM7_ANGAN